MEVPFCGSGVVGRDASVRCCVLDLRVADSQLRPVAEGVDVRIVEWIQGGPARCTYGCCIVTRDTVCIQDKQNAPIFEPLDLGRRLSVRHAVERDTVVDDNLWVGGRAHVGVDRWRD